MHKTLFKASRILANIAGLSFGVAFLGRAIALENSVAINSALGVKTYETVDENGNPVNVLYHDTDFKSVKEVKAHASEVTKAVTDEAIVLLHNQEGALPLKEGAKINAYSISSADLVYTGTGSSGASTTTAVDLPTALEKDGFQLNKELYDAYKGFLGKNYGRGASSGIGATFGIHEVPWDVLPASKTAEADVGLFVLARNGGEGTDLDRVTGDKSDLDKGNYLLLSAKERDVLSHMKALKDAGTLNKIVVFMNSANPVQVDFLEEYGVDALLWASTLGETGAQSFCDILKGTVNPSGRTIDTFFKASNLNPVYANFGDYAYAHDISPLLISNKYVVYQEGIYNGYRYTETRYEDKVLGSANVGEYNYADVVAYPFGYGLTYTSFSYDGMAMEDLGDDYKFTITVKNTGDLPGKEAVQLYAQKVYVPTSGIEKASVELMSFGKTKLLGKGESDTLTLTVAKSELASYDSENLGSYVLEEGDYYFTFAKNAHDAINNILSAKGKTVSDGMVGIGVTPAEGKATLTKKVTIEDRDESSFILSSTGEEIVNQFDNVDINRYDYAESNHVNYVSRSDWAGTVRFGFDAEGNDLHNQVVLDGNDDMAAEADYYYCRGLDDDLTEDFPRYGVAGESKLDLIDLMKDDNGNPIPFEDPKWNKLLDQLTLEDQVSLLSSGLRSTAALSSINKPGTIDHNGATGPMMPYNVSKGNNRGFAVTNNDPDASSTPIVYPSNSMAAATFNQPLMEEYGKVWGEDCLWAGYSGLYGPAVNIHRGSYGGRAFEYYSEDPILSGKICASMCKGISSKGIYVYLKHCLLNDQETNREGVNTWANEQTIREIYLKPFQIAIEEGGCQNVMTGFNRLGTLWTGNQGFLKNVLKKEFGMTGFAVSDFYHKEYMNMSGGIYNGNDLPDGQVTGSELKENAELYPGLAWAMRESVHRILYTVVHSAAMNNIAKNVSIVEVTPGWVTGINVATIALGVLAGVSVVGLGVSLFLKGKQD